ncbi:hypothetical protein JCM33774_88490 [Actinophytocola sp. KF-1]
MSDKKLPQPSPSNERGQKAGGAPPKRRPSGAHAGEEVREKVLSSNLAKNVRGLSLAEQRENVREFLAKRLVALLAGVLAIGLLLLAIQHWTGVNTADIRSLYDVLFSPLIALVSAATGFYFGSTHAESVKPEPEV